MDQSKSKLMKDVQGWGIEVRVRGGTQRVTGERRRGPAGSAELLGGLPGPGASPALGFI